MSIFPDRRTLRRQSTKEEILTAALQLMGQEGVAGMSLSAVARSVGMQPPSLYEYFPSKNAIYDALFERGARDLRRAVLAAGPRQQQAEAPVAAPRRCPRLRGLVPGQPVAAQLLNWRPVPGFEPSPEASSASRAMIEDTS
ncbi:TetR/AcrR family transcriptional regulator [Arthrobacter polaris]|uniref:TetR/AcrR family transcriptional regulator n=1 Tax=Arthrobacter polaris TaxID=2813727 RepID=UPI001F2C031C|nr:TetR/AcrR family transcriptional regulator [Arthrobacter polaris]UIK89015.1 TetR/AcrR family transcriptional regulator [Arthrobacter polaris]